jgi:hypothetical protein
MHKTILPALLLVVWTCAGAQPPQENQELMNAALRLKQAAVLRTLEDCKAKGGSVQSCNSLLELTHQRELKIIERLKLAATDPAVNIDEVSKESAACYDYGYVELVECWSQLSYRLDATRKGQSLLRSAGPSTGATSSTARRALVDPPAPPAMVDTATPTVGKPPQVPAARKGWAVSEDEVNAIIAATPLELQSFHSSPVNDWRDCINDVTSKTHDDPFPKETLDGICRDALHLPWYSHTPYEPALKKFIFPYIGVIIVGGALIIIIGAVWALRRWLANATVTTAKGVDRSVFALTGFGVARWWSGVVQRWRAP